MQINQRTAEIIRFSGLIIPVMLTLYGVLVQYEIVDGTHFFSNELFLGLIIAWVALASYQFLYRSKNRTESAIRLGLYHVFSALYLVMVSGFAMPFLIAWVMLLLASYAYFGGNGSKLSLFFYIVTVLVDMGLHTDSEAIILTNLLSLLSILILGIAVVAMSHVQAVDVNALDRSKELELLQRDRILTIVNNLADAVLSADEHGIIRVYNAASLNLLDTNDSLNGRKIDDIMNLYTSDGKPFRFFRHLQQARGVVVRDDLTFELSEDEKLRLEITYSPIRGSFSRSRGGERHDGYIVILRDVTKAKSLEEERDEFISVVSHELRTPITVAEGTMSNLGLMVERGLASPEKIRQNVDNAHEQILFLARMVNDLSTLSRAERGVADTAEMIDVRAMLNDLYQEYAPQAEAKGLHLNLDLASKLGRVYVSRLYLEELLQNFVTNALKYTKEGSITIDARQKKGSITFTVRDTGIGISKSDQAKIFDKFYRAEDYRTRETSGTGLGLYVATKLARKLHTKIELESRLNHGSSFYFSLPITDADKR